MLYLKKFDSYTFTYPKIPNDWIKLDSIGYVVNPQNGISYPMMRKDNTYEVDNPHEAEVDGYNEISQDDLDLLKDVWVSTDKIIKNKINFNIIETLKDLSLDYVDDGMMLSCRVFCDEFKLGSYMPIPVYYESLTKDKNHKHYAKYFLHKTNLIKSSTKMLYGFDILDWETSKDKKPYKSNSLAEKNVLKSIKGIAKDNGWNEYIYLGGYYQ